MNKEQRILERTYKDKLTVYGWENYIDPDTLESKKRKILKYDDVKCGLSKSNTGKPETGEFTSDINDEFVIFASPDIFMKANDVAIVKTAMGQIYEGKTSKSFVYSSHGETKFKVEVKA